MAGREKYDPKKDELVKEFSSVKTEKGKGIAVQARSYDGGPIRVVIQRFVKTEDGDKKYYAAGRLNGNEIAATVKGLKRARKWYEENESSESEEKPKEKKAAKKEKHHHHRHGKKVEL